VIAIPLRLTNSHIFLLRLRGRFILRHCSRILLRLGLVIWLRLVISLDFGDVFRFCFVVRVGFSFVVCGCFVDRGRVGFINVIGFRFANRFFVVVVFLPVAGDGEGGAVGGLLVWGVRWGT
jgi:hypothetical protein